MVKNLPVNAGDVRDVGLIPGSGRSSGGRYDNPLQYSCLGESHGLRSLLGYSLWGYKESNTPEATEHTGSEPGIDWNSETQLGDLFKLRAWRSHSFFFLFVFFFFLSPNLPNVCGNLRTTIFFVVFQFLIRLLINIWRNPYIHCMTQLLWL